MPPAVPRYEHDHSEVEEEEDEVEEEEEEEEEERADLSNGFVSRVARSMNEAGIPCVLWGHCLYNVHGIPSILGSVDFVVPDHQLEDAHHTLSRMECLLPCPDGDSCRVIDPHRPTQPPSSHLHIQKAEEPVGLYTQSETLWFLPLLDASLLHADGGSLPSEYVLASDDTWLPPGRLGRGSGRFESGDGPVIVPKSHVFLEASMRIHARDSGSPHGGFSMTPISYIWMYVDDDGLLDSGKLPAQLQIAYERLKNRKGSLREWTAELRTALKETSTRD